MSAAVLIFPAERLRRAETPPAFAGFGAALAWWTYPERDRAPLAAAVRPPVDALGDDVHDAALAVLFKRMVPLGSAAERIILLETFAELNRRQAAAFLSWAERARENAEAAASRIGAMLAVIERWKGELAEGGA